MDEAAGHLLRRAYARARRNTAEALAVLGDLSPVQAGALAALIDGALPQAELGRRIDMEPANIHSLVARLRGAGLVASRRENGQALVALTDEGGAVADRIEPLVRASTARTLGALDEGERTIFLRLLARIATD